MRGHLSDKGEYVPGGGYVVNLKHYDFLLTQKAFFHKKDSVVEVRVWEHPDAIGGGIISIQYDFEKMPRLYEFRNIHGLDDCLAMAKKHFE